MPPPLRSVAEKAGNVGGGYWVVVEGVLVGENYVEVKWGVDG